MQRRGGVLLLVAIVGAVIIIATFNRGEAITTTTSVNSKPVIVEAEAKKVTRIGIQAGHWKNSDMPSEFHKLLSLGGGTEYGSTTEAEVSLNIANKVADLLKNNGYEIDVLPATIPEDYSADLFLSIHTDGNDYNYVNGYKVAGSFFDTSGKSAELAKAIKLSYGNATKMELDTNITDNMTQYYAFNYIKYNHSISAKTPGAIIELGFLTNSSDRSVMTKHADTLAKGIADGIISYLAERNN